MKTCARYNSQIADHGNRFNRRLDQTLEVNSENIDEMLENFRHVSQNLKEFTDIIKARPYTSPAVPVSTKQVSLMKNEILKRRRATALVWHSICLAPRNSWDWCWRRFSGY